MKKSLLNTNPYLKNASQQQLERDLACNIESSSAIEGIRVKRDAQTGRFMPRKTDQTSTKIVNRKDR